MKRVTINNHNAFWDSLRIANDFDEDMDDLIQRDPYENFHGRRSDKEINKTLAILDELENEQKGGIQ